MHILNCYSTNSWRYIVILFFLWQMWPGLLNELCQHDRKHLSAVSIPKGCRTGSVSTAYLVIPWVHENISGENDVWSDKETKVLLGCFHSYIVWSELLGFSVPSKRRWPLSEPKRQSLARQKEVVLVHIKLNHGLVHFQSENIILNGSDHCTNDKMLRWAT